MGLKAKFNLVMLVAFLIGLSLAAALAYRIVQDNARREVLQDAAIMMEQASAIRSYTSREIGPLLAEQSKIHFLPHTIPAWAAQTNFRKLQQDFPDYSYREPALNPTNPANKAQPWEADIVNTFRHDPKLTELVSERQTPTGPILSMSRPLRANDKQCLTCHSTPSVAPASMIELYGSDNGFGWQLGDVIAAQVVSVPMRVPLDQANRTFLLFVAGLAVVFLVMIVLLNLLLHFVIVRPVRRISAIAGEVSLGNMEAREFTVRGRDEIASLAESFNRMRRSLANALRMLEE
jgi:HAMP domain-containing protein